MLLSFNIGSISVSMSSTGGVRVGGKIGKTYISTQVVEPKKKKKKEL